MFSSCCSKKTLDGCWTVKEMVANGESKTVVPANMNIEEAEDGTLTAYGNSGVNTFTGQIELKDGKILRQIELACTKMMGEPEPQAFEDMFFTLLSEASEYELNENTLIIKGKDSSFIKFEK